MRFGLGDETVSEKKRAIGSAKSSSMIPVASGHPSPAIYYAMTLPFIGLFLYLSLYLYRAQLDSKMLQTERPIFSQLRPLRIRDLNSILIQQMEHHYPKPVELRLEKYHGRGLLRVYSGNKLMFQRALIYGDLDPDEILQRYFDKTGDRADSIQITYRRGEPYLYIYSSDDVNPQ